MKGPHWQVPNGAHAGGITTATDRGNGGTAVRISKRERPGAEATHTQAGDIDPLRINGVVPFDLLEQRREYIRRLGLTRWTLRRDNDKRAIGPLLDYLGDTMAFDQVQIIPPFPRAV
jgi:hypothetical protein